MISTLKSLFFNLDPVSKGIILINLLFYGYNLYENNLSAITGLNAQELLSIGGLNSDTPFYTYIVSIFSHLSFLHLTANTLMVLVLGRMVYQNFGGLTYLATFLGSGFIGNIMSVFIQPEVLTAGASGGVSGMLGMLLSGAFLKSGLFEMKGMIVGMVIFYVIATFIDPNVNITSHISGLSTGVIVGGLIPLLMKRV